MIPKRVHRGSRGNRRSAGAPSAGAHRPRPVQDAAQPLPAESVVISLVVPVYNEEEVLCETSRRLRDVMEGLGEPYEILFVDDGSSDDSDRILEELRCADEHVGVLTFSRNFGHQVAITAGMEHARGQAVVVIDADLQDPPEVIPEMVARWREGYEVVYAERLERQGESTFKRWSAALFYRMLRRVGDVQIPIDTGDFRLIDRKVRDALVRMPEKHRFVRGLVAWLGFHQCSVQFVRAARHAGRTKYGLSKMLALGFDGILSFSDLPLRITGYAGALVAIASVIFVVIYLAAGWAGGALAAWPIVLAAFGVVQGAILVAVGMLGAYLARVYDEVRDRPLYVLSRRAAPGRAGKEER